MDSPVLSSSTNADDADDDQQQQLQTSSTNIFDDDDNNDDDDFESQLLPHPSLQFVCCSYLQGDHCEDGDDCPFQHVRSDFENEFLVQNLPCQFGDNCLLKHYKRQWVACESANECCSCGKMFRFLNRFSIFPFRRKHHCRRCASVCCLECLQRDYFPYPICLKCERSVDLLIEKDRLEQERIQAEMEMQKTAIKARWQRVSSGVALKITEESIKKQQEEKQQARQNKASFLSRVAALGKKDKEKEQQQQQQQERQKKELQEQQQQNTLSKSESVSEKKANMTKSNGKKIIVRKVVVKEQQQQNRKAGMMTRKKTPVCCKDMSSDDEMFGERSDYSSSDEDYDKEVAERAKMNIDHSLADLLLNDDNDDEARGCFRQNSNTRKTTGLRVRFEDQVQQELEDEANVEMLFRSGPFGSRIREQQQQQHRHVDHHRNDDDDDFDRFFRRDSSVSAASATSFPSNSSSPIKSSPPAAHRNKMFYFGVNDDKEFGDFFLHHHHQHHHQNNQELEDFFFDRRPASSPEHDELFKAGHRHHNKNEKNDDSFVLLLDDTNNENVVTDNHQQLLSALTNSASPSKVVFPKEKFEKTLQMQHEKEKEKEKPKKTTIKKIVKTNNKTISNNKDSNVMIVQNTHHDNQKISTTQNDEHQQQEQQEQPPSASASSPSNSGEKPTDSIDRADDAEITARRDLFLKSRKTGSNLGSLIRSVSLSKSAENLERSVTESSLTALQRVHKSDDELVRTASQLKRANSERRRLAQLEREKQLAEEELDEWMRKECCCCGCCSCIAGTSCGRKLGGVARIWRRFGVEIVMVLSLVGVVVIAAYFLLELTVSHFTRHQDCVACFTQVPSWVNTPSDRNNYNYNYNNNNNNASSAAPSPSSSSSRSFIAFNFTSGKCVTQDELSLRVLSDLYNPNNDLIAEQAFCGAAQCRSLEILPGYRPMPYWLAILGSVMGIFSTASVNLFKKLVLIPLKIKLCGFVDPIRMLSKEARSLAFRFFVFGSTDSYWYMFLYLLTMGNLGIKIWQIFFENVRYKEMSFFAKYEAVNLLWLNSGTVQILCIFYIQILNGISASSFITQAKCPKAERSFLGDGEKSLLAKMMIPLATLFGEQKALRAHVLLLPLPLLPIIISHIIPSLILFFPIPAVLILIWFSVGYLFDRKLSKKRFTKKWQVFFLLSFRVLSNIVFLVLFQTLAGYSTLLYQSVDDNPLRIFTEGFDWVGVISREFNTRSTVCYANHISNSLQSYNLGFATMLLG